MVRICRTSRKQIMYLVSAIPKASGHTNISTLAPGHAGITSPLRCKP